MIVDNFKKGEALFNLSSEPEPKKKITPVMDDIPLDTEEPKPKEQEPKLEEQEPKKEDTFFSKSVREIEAREREINPDKSYVGRNIRSRRSVRDGDTFEVKGIPLKFLDLIAKQFNNGESLSKKDLVICFLASCLGETSPLTDNQKDILEFHQTDLLSELRRSVELMHYKLNNLELLANSGLLISSYHLLERLAINSKAHRKVDDIAFEDKNVTQVIKLAEDEAKEIHKKIFRTQK